VIFGFPLQVTGRCGMIFIVVWGAVERHLRGVEMGGQAGKRVKIVLLLISSILFAGVAIAKYSGGTGEPDAPYLISTPADLNDIGNHPEDFSKCFLQTADIDLTPYTGTQFKIIGNEGTPFAGVFDGGGHSISNFEYLPTTYYKLGLFGYVGTAGIIRNVILIEPNVSGGNRSNVLGTLIGYLDYGTVENCSAENVSVTGEALIVGGLIGRSSGGRIENCSSSGNVFGSGSIGGLIGSSQAEIVSCNSSCFVKGMEDFAINVGGLAGWSRNLYSCHSTGTVDGYYYVGGLTGNNDGNIVNCFSTSNVYGTQEVGGLIGEGGGSKIISGCYASGAVQGELNVGGLAGRSKNVSFCYSTGTVQGGDNVGGLIGFDIGQTTGCYSYSNVSGSDYVGGLEGEGAVVTDCYARGTVNGTRYVGGLIGRNSHTIDIVTNSYSTGLVNGTGSYVGGLVGANSGVVNYGYWDVNTSGQTTSAGGDGRTTAQMKSASTYTGWETRPTVWNIQEGIDYPHLIWEGLPGEPIRRYSGGSGEPDDPYLISTPADLNDIGNHVDDFNKCFLMTSDINLAQYTGSQFKIIGPDSTTPFKGIFDGGGHRILNFTYNGFDNSAIFGCVNDPNAVIRSVGLIKPDVKGGSGSNIGSLVGYLESGTIDNCYADDVNISGTRQVGGLIGNSTGIIRNCHSLGKVRGDTNVGGLAGGNWNQIVSCYSSCDVEGSWSSAGGLAGRSEQTLMSYSTGSVNGYSYVGGLVGYGGAERCYSTAEVNGTSNVGGLIGRSYNNVTDCYSFGSVSATNNAGGLVGYVYIGEIKRCYSAGSVVGGSGGGLTGGYYLGQTEISDSFWDVNTSGWLTSYGGEGKTTAQMKQATTFAAWGGCISDPIWTIDNGNDYPRLYWQGLPGEALIKYASGSGEADDPYLIGTAQQLNTIGLIPDDWGKCFKLIADIDMAELEGNQFNIIGNTTVPFTGVFDGDCHTISDLTYDGNGVNYVGLFGFVDGLSAEIKRVGLINPHINAGAGGNVGALVGYNIQVIISECWVRGGSVSGDSSVGGLIGRTYGTLLNSYASTDVSGSDNVGGLAGYNGYIIRDCYSAGPVSGVTNTGGLVGGTGGSEKTYDSYWDTQTSGQDISAGGEGKTTAQMQQADTFAGWGCDVVWTIDNGNDYPRLICENVPGEPIDAHLSDYFGGNGTSDAPYLISDAAGLNMVGQLDCVWDKHFKLVADIDMSVVPGEAYHIIGTYEKPFTGVFDGNGHTISNFSCITNSSYAGLFGVIDDENSYIFNLRLVNPYIDANSGRDVGSLVGLVNRGNIIDCNIEGGSVSGTDSVGVFAGQVVAGQILNCYASGSVSGRRWVGGFIGSAGIPGTIEITNCHSNTAVFGADFVGGFAGRALYGPTSMFSRISGCTAIVQVNATGSNVGGFSGLNDGNLSDCGVWGDVSGLDSVGGLVGNSLPYSQIRTSRFSGTVTGRWNVGGIFGSNLISGSSYIITSSYAEGQVAGDANVGGLAGRNSGKQIKNCYSACELSGNSNVGGLIGYSSNNLPSNCIWDMEISEINIPCGYGYCSPISNKGRTTELMKSVYAMAVFACDPNWTIDDGVSTPRLSWENQPGTFIYDAIYDSGSGEPEDPILIYKPEQLLALGCVPCIFDKSFRLVNDLNLADYNLADYFRPIGSSGYELKPAGAFRGTFDGDGHIISDFNFTSGIIQDYPNGNGLFGILDTNALIKNTGMLKPNIIAAGPAGSLVGRINKGGTVSNCFSAGGRIINSGGGSTGGLVGDSMAANARIIDSYSITDVCGPYCGGLVGYNIGEVNRCYSAGKVSQYSTYPVGGLIGYGAGLVNNSFWDVNTSGRLTSAGGTGLTTEQMKTYSYFADAGWDFDNVWHICETTNYPKLMWQIPTADYFCPYGVDFVDYSYLASHWLQTDYGDCNGIDLTGDAKVDLTEFAILAGHWQQSDCGVCGGADYSGDGSVDIEDLAILCDNWPVTEYGDVEGAELTGDGIVNLDDAFEFSRQWLQGF
jgi:hypothetical protein